jgi:hypothetical protein
MTETELRRKRWFVYPSLIVVYIPVLAVLLLWPMAAIAGLGQTYDLHVAHVGMYSEDSYPYWTLTLLVGAMVTGLWLIAAGFLSRTFAPAVNVIFRPFADGRRFGAGIIWTGAAVSILSMLLFVAFRWIVLHQPLF